MESRVEQTIERHKKGYNCAQAVACTYCDLFGVDEQTAYKMSEGFGLGMGQQNVCGALTGALMLAGLENSGGVETPGTTKGATYRKARELAEKFKDTTGALLCKDIKAGPKKYSCEGCILHAAHLVEENLINK